MTSRYLLDTNIVSHMLRGHPQVAMRVRRAPMAQLCISVLTEAELHYGLAKRPEAKRLQRAVEELLLRVEVLPWTSRCALSYGRLRAQCERDGRSLDALDLLIGAHALAEAAVLVTADRAFSHVSMLVIEDWTAD
jgi:tRNA(fMet)-specific endonuclease VapC